MGERKNLNDEILSACLEFDRDNLKRNEMALKVTRRQHGDTKFCRDVAKEIKWYKAQLRCGESILARRDFEHSQDPEF